MAYNDNPSYLKLAGGTMTGALVLNADPVVALGAVTKQYADAIAAGLDFKNSCVAATTAPLTVTYLNGVAGVGATLTNAGTQATFSIDGQSPSVTQRVLIKDQSSTLQNGIYIVTNVGSGSTNWILTRALDYDQPSEIAPGDLVPVTAGTVNIDTIWLETATVTTIGTDPITFSRFQSAPITTTQYDVLVGGANNSISSVGPGSAGQVLQSGGNAANPAYSTATFPSTATGTGTLLRADGTNWTATTSTYPNTNALNTLLYASSANIMSALATATNGVLITDGTTGIPSISSTLPTAVQGNITSVGALASGSLTTGFTAVNVAQGGTGRATLTNHGVLVGAATTAITQLAAGSAGQVLQSGGASADPAYSTATYPATATGTGTILRADGTNWVATTSTYPNTNAVSTLLYASSANVMGALATANSGVLTTSSSGVPSIDTTNFAVLSTGVQMKGNNTNTAPPAGFIGEQIRSAVASASAITLTDNVAANVTNISLTAGIWDVSGIVQYSGNVTGTANTATVTTTSATTGTLGDNYVLSPQVSTLGADNGIIVPAYRITLTTNTTTYLVAFARFSVGTQKAYGRISATRVG